MIIIITTTAYITVNVCFFPLFFTSQMFYSFFYQSSVSKPTLQRYKRTLNYYANKESLDTGM